MQWKKQLDELQPEAFQQLKSQDYSGMNIAWLLGVENKMTVADWQNF